jgi:hypothetical protein
LKAPHGGGLAGVVACESNAALTAKLTVVGGRSTLRAL